MGGTVERRITEKNINKIANEFCSTLLTIPDDTYMPVAQIAEELGLTEHQVSRVCKYIRDCAYGVQFDKFMPFYVISSKSGYALLKKMSDENIVMHDCTGYWSDEEENWETDFVPNPFEIKDLTEEERQLKDSRTTLYLVDVTGKLIYVYNGRLEDAGESQIARLPLPMLSTGVYIVKAFYDGEWHAKKIFIH